LAVGASAVAWFLPLWRGASPPVDALTVVSPSLSVPESDWTPMLTKGQGAEVAIDPNAADLGRFKLVGVAGATTEHSEAGVALIALDGKPAKAYRVGDAVDGNRVVLQVAPNTVRIGAAGGPPSVTLQAPLLPPPATGKPASAS